MEYSSQKELFEDLKPAFSVKRRLLSNNGLDYIQVEDIWNYLKITKWRYDYGLTISEMVDDIIHVDEKDIDKYLKDKLAKEKKELFLD